MSLKYRIVKDRIVKFGFIFLSAVSVSPLFLVLYYIFKNGISVISIEFLTSLPKPAGEEGGGIANAIVGTFMLSFIALILSTVPGVLAGIYLAEYKETKLASIVRTATETLHGVPSIIIGIIGYLWVVKPLGHFSALSGGVALGIMMLPVIIKSTEEVLKLIPVHIKEAAFALGVPYYRVVLKVLVPSGLSGILTGILIATSRIAGETAPLLFTAFGDQFMNLDIFKPVNALPLVIFNYAMSPYVDLWKQAWGASCILTILVLSFNILTRLITRKWKVKF